MTPTKDVLRQRMYINGEWTSGASESTIEVLNPANLEVFAEVPRGTSADVDAAVRAARAAFENPEWREILPAERGRMMLRMANLLREKKEELAQLETLDCGKPISQSLTDIEVAARYFEYYAGVSDKILGETIPVAADVLDYTLREPVGVTAHIVPWNYPIQIACRSIAPALATGNTVVVKPAEDTPMTALKLADLCEEAGIPRGVYNVITGYGFEVGAALSAHPDLDHITFTGSVDTGIAVMKAAAANITPVTLELGGKSPNIVFADADLEDAANWVVRAITQNAGQTCAAGSRLIVEKSIQKDFVARVVERMGKLKLGEGKDNPDVGPVINKKQVARIESYMEIAKQEGRAILVGGKTSSELPSGTFFEPTVVEATPDSRLAQEEIFGPVLVVYPFETKEEALSLANSTDYGLVTGIWTSNINKAHWLAGRVRSGQVFINNYGAGGGVEMPFGGSKKSGIGREKGLEALKSYTQVKNVALKIHS